MRNRGPPDGVHTSNRPGAVPVNRRSSHARYAQKVRWTQNGRTTVLGTANADRQGTVRVTVTVPVTATAGRAMVRVGASNPEPVTVTGP